MMEIQTVVIGVISRQLELPKDTVKPDSRIAEDLGADSLDQAEIMMDLEDEFNLTVSDDDAKTIRTVSDAVLYIEKQVGGSR